MKNALKTSLLLTTLLLAFALSTCLSNTLSVDEHPYANGPRTEDLLVNYYADIDAAYAALKADEIDIIGSSISGGGPPPVDPNQVESFIWAASWGSGNIANNELQGRAVEVDNPGIYNGVGLPYWTGNFSLAHSISTVNSITANFVANGSSRVLVEGVDYKVHPDEDLVELLVPIDVPIVNEHWVDGVNNTLNGWPWINYVASGIQSVVVHFPNCTKRAANNLGHQQPPPSEWWFEPDWAQEVEGWWALGYYSGSWNWPAGSEWWVNYTAASHLTVDYNIDPPPVDPYTDAINDPNILLAPVAETNLVQLDVNNNYTIHQYPGVVNMMWYAPVRRALAWCTYKDYIVDVFCGGFAERIDAPIAAPAKAWANESYWYPNYPYEYDPAAASNHLNANGWDQGSTPNPNYDPGFPGSAEYLRVYGNGHPNQGTNVDAIHWYIRTDDLRKFYAGHLCADAMEKIGFTVIRHEGDLPTLRPSVMIEKNYHVYTGEVNVGLFPTYLYTLYHSSFWIEGASTSNYVTGNNASGLPNYPQYDAFAEALNYPKSYDEAIDASKFATAYWVEECINVPLFSTRSYWAYSDKVLAAVSMEGEGFENGYSFMNCYKTDLSPIRYGVVGAPNALNQIYSSFHSDYQNLDRMNIYGGPEAPPYDLGLAQAGWLQDWEVGIWDNDGSNATYITKWFRPDSYFAEPISGNLESQANASDFFFSCWYTHADPTTSKYSTVQEIHHIDIADDQQVTVYFTSESFWHYLSASPMILPVDVWLRDPLAVQSVENFPGFTGPGTVALTGIPVWINQITMDGSPLTFGVDYNLFGSGPGVSCTLEILTAQGPGTLSVDYYAYGDPAGFTPGDLPWSEISEGCGMYYLTSFTPGVGGGATYKRNPYYWMETPHLGEIDFVWKYQSGSKPRTGGYRIDVYDLAKCAAAVGSQGYAVPDPHWFPGADLILISGIIDDFDAVFVGTAMGVPPPGYDIALLDFTPFQTEVTSGEPLSSNVTVKNLGAYTETFTVGIRAEKEKVVTEETTLESGKNITLTLTWDTTGYEGEYEMSAYAGPIMDGEPVLNNIIVDGTVTVNPVEHTIIVETAGGKQNLTLESDTTLTHIVATKNILHFTATGPPGRTAHINATIPANLNTTSITVFINNQKLTPPPFPIITTNGSHYFIYFECSLSTHEIAIEYATPETIVTDVGCLKTVAGQGYPSSINVTVHNQGDQTKTFNVTLYADQNALTLGDEVIIGMQNTTLAGGAATNLTFTWTTDGTAKGNYTLCATADNAEVGGCLFITIAGDVDGDRDVDIYDIVRMCGVYGISLPDTRYDPNSDWTNDGIINIYDIVIAADNYQKSW